MHWYDVAGSLGVAMIVCAYFFLQLGRVASDSLGYLLANAFGAGLILISLSVDFNFSGCKSPPQQAENANCKPECFNQEGGEVEVHR